MVEFHKGAQRVSDGKNEDYVNCECVGVCVCNQNQQWTDFKIFPSLCEPAMYDCMKSDEYVKCLTHIWHSRFVTFICIFFICTLISGHRLQTITSRFVAFCPFLIPHSNELRFIHLSGCHVRRHSTEILQPKLRSCIWLRQTELNYITESSRNKLLASPVCPVARLLIHSFLFYLTNVYDFIISYNCVEFSKSLSLIHSFLWHYCIFRITHRSFWVEYFSFILQM